MLGDFDSVKIWLFLPNNLFVTSIISLSEIILFPVKLTALFGISLVFKIAHFKIPSIKSSIYINLLAVKSDHTVISSLLWTFNANASKDDPGICLGP